MTHEPESPSPDDQAPDNEPPRVMRWSNGRVNSTLFLGPPVRGNATAEELTWPVVEPVRRVRSTFIDGPPVRGNASAEELTWPVVETGSEVICSSRVATITYCAEAGVAKSLMVQVQPARSPDLDAEAAVSRLQALAPATVDRSEDDGPYINVRFRAVAVGPVWAAVREQLRADPALARCVIACCEGDRGWDDYRLLHHFDPSQPLDEVA